MKSGEKLPVDEQGRPVYGPEKERHRLIRLLVHGSSERAAMEHASDLLEIMRLRGHISHHHFEGLSTKCEFEGGEELDNTYGLPRVYRYSDPMGQMLVRQLFESTRNAHVNTWKTLFRLKVQHGPEPQEYEEGIGEMLEQCWEDFEILGNPANPVNLLFDAGGTPVFTEEHLAQVTQDPANTWVVGALVAAFVNVKVKSWKIRKMEGQSRRF